MIHSYHYSLKSFKNRENIKSNYQHIFNNNINVELNTLLTYSVVLYFI